MLVDGAIASCNQVISEFQNGWNKKKGLRGIKLPIKLTF